MQTLGILSILLSVKISIEEITRTFFAQLGSTVSQSYNGHKRLQEFDDDLLQMSLTQTNHRVTTAL